MNGRRALYLQSIRGPVVLITVGVLFAIHQAGILSFGRTWPLLFIIVGVMKLLERAFAPAATLQPPYASAAAYQHGTYPNPAYTPQPQSPAAGYPSPTPPAAAPSSTSSEGGVQR
jgi:predicted lipid-binding transport protein (Tim44 family)